MKKVIEIAVFCLASFLSISNTAHAEEGKKVQLGWEAKYKTTYMNCSDCSPVAVRVLSAQVIGGNLIFDILIHNEEQRSYMCVWFNTSENAVHIDDELGNVYKGGEFTLSPMDNKFAPNQRKRLKVILQEPDHEAKLVNIHFGFSVERVSGEPQKRCGDSIIGNGELNFHKPDWDMSKLR